MLGLNRSKCAANSRMRARSAAGGSICWQLTCTGKIIVSFPSHGTPAAWAGARAGAGAGRNDLFGFSGGERMPRRLADRRQGIADVVFGDLLARVRAFPDCLARQIGERDHPDQGAVVVDDREAADV